MRPARLLLLLSFSPLVSSALTAQNSADPNLTTQMRAEDQLLLAAIHNGNRGAWDKATADDFVYIEEGGITRRPEFLKEIVQDGATTLRIRSYELHRFGDTIVVLHHDDIPASNGYVTRPGGEYIMSETWQLMDGAWKLHMVHIDSVRTDPPVIELTSSQLDEVVGTYRSGDVIYSVYRDGIRLVGSRPGHPDTEMLAETRDVFFVPGDTRSRRIFQRDAKGAVTGFVRRDENSDKLWLRIDTK